MKAAVLFELNKPLQIIEIDEIPKLKNGQVLIDVIYTGLCQSQVMEIFGGRGEDKYLPHLLGHEAVGRVADIGPGVSKVEVDDLVVLGWIRGDGMEAPGGIYSYNGQKINSGGVTTFSEQTIVAENRLVRLPPLMPLKLAVLLGCALPTGTGLVLNELKPKFKSKIAVVGLGGIGLSALIALQMFDPDCIVALDIEEQKLSLAIELGATHKINLSNKSWMNQMLEVAPNGFDYIIEASGVASVVSDMFKLVKDNGGVCITASHPPEGHKIEIDALNLHKGKRLIGSWGGGSKPDQDIPRIAKLYHERQLPFDKLISEGYTLENINNAVYDLKDRKINRALIIVNQELADKY